MGEIEGGTDLGGEILMVAGMDRDKRNKEIGARIRRKRLAIKPRLAQWQAAERIGMSQGYWAAIENGKAGSITIGTLDKIATSLKVKASTLI